MEELDHVAARVSVLSIVGGMAGAANGALRGGHAILRTAGLTAFSCALAGTACFSIERLAAAAYRQSLQYQDENNNSPNHPSGIILTHAIGGFLGGALMGTLYMKRPLRGIVFMTPFMVLVGMGEHLYQDMREERIRELLSKSKDDDQ